jgi:DNA polymerase I-like protein with 3'-5' exonuclease and polymerase domains
MAKAAWTPPPDPDLQLLAETGWRQWEMDQPTVLAFDTETTGLEYYDTAFCVTIAWASDDVIQGRIAAGHYFELDRIDCREAVATILDRAEVLIGHNVKFDLHKLEVTMGWQLKPWQQLHDTEAMAHLLDEHQPKGLKDLAVSVLGESDTILVPATKGGVEYEKEVPREKWEIEQARVWAKRHYGLDSVADVGYHLLPRGTVVPYAIKDAEWTLRLGGRLHPQVLAFPDLTELYEREMLLTRTALYSLEKAGLGVRLDYVNARIAEYRTKVLKHEGDIEAIVGKQVRTGKIPTKERDQYFNPASNSEIAAYFTAAGYPREQYQAEQLREIPHPLAAKLLEYRSDKKLLETYFEGLKRDTGADGVYHPSIRQHGTVTGRTSSGSERGDS